jgi:hypothetical protein
MKITICGSSTFIKEKSEFKDKLLKAGHEPIINENTERILTEPELLEHMNREPAEFKKKYDMIKWYYDAIKNTDAILIVNPEKKGIKNYIGANSFLEMGYAHVLKKKIFILYEKPDQKYIKDEIDAMDIIELHGHLEKIRE